MKKIFLQTVILIVTCILITSALHSQSALGIPYQALIRDNAGSPLMNAAVTVRFTLHQNEVAGAVEYQETQSLTTNVYGLVNTHFGQGTPTQGSFAGIIWSNTSKFIQVEANDGNGYVDMGTQQMMSVPYSYYSDESGKINVEVSVSGDTLFLGNSNFVIIPGVSVNNGSMVNTGISRLPGNDTCDDQIISVSSCNSQNSVVYDGRTYDLVEIGGQCWFADNLSTDQYRNGDPIATGLSVASFENTVSGTYDSYDNNVSNDLIYGKLYNWYATVDVRGLCPTGWHVPTDCDWMYLERSLGMSPWVLENFDSRGTNQGGQLKGIEYWNSPNFGASNSSSFSAYPGGYKEVTSDYFFQGLAGFWWTSSDRDMNYAYFRGAWYATSNIIRNFEDKNTARSVRCVRD